MSFGFKPVRSLYDAERLRQTHNACADGLTSGRTEPISTEEQAVFWRTQLATGIVRAWLFTRWHPPATPDGASHTEDVGFALLKPDPDPAIHSDRLWMTAGIRPQYRRRGWSRTLIEWVTWAAYEDPYVEVWINVWHGSHALPGDIHCGYVFVSEEERDGRRLHVMRHIRNQPVGPAEAGYLMRRELEEVDAITRGGRS